MSYKQNFKQILSFKNNYSLSQKLEGGNMKCSGLGVALALIVGLLVLLSFMENEKSSYFIYETIPGKMIIVRAHGFDDLTWELSDGLREVSKKYEIIAQTPIIGRHFFGSRTVALILSVKPK